MELQKGPAQTQNIATEGQSLQTTVLRQGRSASAFLSCHLLLCFHWPSPSRPQGQHSPGNEDLRSWTPASEVKKNQALLSGRGCIHSEFHMQLQKPLPLSLSRTEMVLQGCRVMATEVKCSQPSRKMGLGSLISLFRLNTGLIILP